jgi:hypothetical protein
MLTFIRGLKNLIIMKRHRTRRKKLPIFRVEEILRGRSLPIGKILTLFLISSTIFGLALSIFYILEFEAYFRGNIFLYTFEKTFEAYLNPVTIFSFTIISLLFYLILASTILHGLSRIFVGKGKFKDTFNVVGISLIPFLLYGWIPIVNVWALIYSQVLLAHGLSIKHKLSIAKSTLSVFILLILTLSFILFYLPLTI